jgi:predicted acetyltransferase/N-acetylglutamate synthase-like GNAT family acetyltransferase
VRQATGVDVREGRAGDRAFIEQVLVERWTSPAMVSRGRVRDAGSLPSLIAESDGVPVGLLTFCIERDELEIVSLDALRDGVGAGSALLQRAGEVAMGRGCRRIWLVTTNDNLAALGFYQRRGFRLAALRAGAIDQARRLKPGIPPRVDGIVVRDELELERVLVPAAPPEVRLQPVSEEQRTLLGNLLQLYTHEFSAWRQMELGEDGRYSYRYFDAYFTEPERHAWIIREGKATAGFAMVRECEDGRHDVSEFFVLRAHRRGGIGRAAAALMFEALPGEWQVRHDLANDEASSFWPAVVEAAAVGPVERRIVGPPEDEVEHAVFRFSTE